MKKSIVSLFLAVAMLLLFVSMTAFAGAEPAVYPVWVCGVQVTENNKSDVLGNSSVSFDSAKGILTLKNATLSVTGSASGFGYGIQCVCAVKSELDKLTVNLVGNNLMGKAVNSDSVLDDYSIDMGFSYSGDIAFTGNAGSSLTIYDYCAGIRAKNVAFGEDFNGKLTIRDSGGPEPQPPCAINAFCVRDIDSGEYISDGTVSILGGTFDIQSFESNGIESDGDVTIKNAKVSSVASYNAIDSEYGKITIKDSDITAVGNTAINAYEGDVFIEKSNLKIKSTACEGISARDISLKDCAEVKIISREDSIYSGRNVSIINCPYISIDCYELTGICGRDIIIDNSKADVIARDGNGIRASLNGDGNGNGSITVKNSKIDIHASRHGIECNSLSVIGGKTHLYSVGDTDSDGKGCGVYIDGDESAIGISGGTAEFTSGEAAIKLEKESKTNPYTGILPNASFKGNTNYDTFTSMQAVNYKNQKKQDMDAFSESAYVGDALAKSVSVVHIHKLVKVDGLPSTAKAAGYKDYYECKDGDNGCGALFEDENGTVPIENFEAWKSKGGNGYLPKSASPDTSDASNIALWLMILSLSSAGLCVLLPNLFKNKKKYN